jgi:hypothetical protein
MNGDPEIIRTHLPAFGSRLTQAMDHADVSAAELTRRLCDFGLQPSAKYVYRLTSIREPANPTLATLAGLRYALDVNSEWWFNPSLTGADLPTLALERP